MARLAIIGAGVSGLTAAWSLRSHPIEVTIFEKSRGYSGRAATRGKYGARYDHGANFVVPSTERVQDLLFEHLPTDNLQQIEGEIWTFDGDGTLHESADDAETEMWTYARGISTLGKLIARAIPAVKHTETRIASLHRRDDAWTLADTDGGRHGPFDAILLTPPAPQTADILTASADAVSSTHNGTHGETLTELADAASDAQYHAQFTYVFGYDRTVRRHGNYHGVRNADGEHDIAWISFEHDKPERVEEGESIVVIQMSPKWTGPKVNSEPDGFLSEAKEKASDVLDASLKRPSWYDTQRWRYSLPERGADRDRLAGGADVGLFFAGDYVVGKGRISDAIETGFDAADSIRSALEPDAA